MAKTMIWTGRVLSALVVLFLVGTATMGLMKPQMIVDGMKQHGYPEHVAIPIVIVEICCAVIYAIPQTSVLGAILLTGYFGGATATHVRVSEPNFWVPVLVGFIVWLGLYLRDPRIRALVPLRR